MGRKKIELEKRDDATQAANERKEGKRGPLKPEELAKLQKRVVAGDPLALIAADLNCSVKTVSYHAKKYVKTTLRRSPWLGSYRFDLLRAEKLIKKCFEKIDDEDERNATRWAQILVSLLLYRLRVVGPEVVAPREDLVRVAGKTPDELAEEILKGL